MAKYLDLSGLSRLWGKITSKAVMADRVMSLSASEQSQARANIMAGGSNRNLLDNPWFTVRQRGNGPFSGAGYTVDRWKIAGGNVVVTPRSPYGVNLNWTTACAYDEYFDIDPQILVGKTVTLSAMVDGVVYSQSAVYSTSGAYVITITVGNVLFRLGYFTSTGRVFIRIGESVSNVATNVNVDAVKLELGSVSTLANDVPPNYAEELAKCQPYFLRLKSSSQSLPLGFGVQSSSTAVRLLIPTPVEMRSQPTVSFSGTHRIFGGDAVSKDVTSYTVVDRTSSGIGLIANISSGTFAENKVYVLYVASGGYLDLSANL